MHSHLAKFCVLRLLILWGFKPDNIIVASTKARDVISALAALTLSLSPSESFNLILSANLETLRSTIRLSVPFYHSCTTLADIGTFASTEAAISRIRTKEENRSLFWVSQNLNGVQQLGSSFLQSHTFCRTLAALFEHGVDFKWNEVFKRVNYQQVPLPLYRY